MPLKLRSGGVARAAITLAAPEAVAEALQGVDDTLMGTEPASGQTLRTWAMIEDSMASRLADMAQDAVEDTRYSVREKLTDVEAKMETGFNALWDQRAKDFRSVSERFEAEKQLREQGIWG